MNLKLMPKQEWHTSIPTALLDPTHMATMDALRLIDLFLCERVCLFVSARTEEEQPERQETAL